MPAKLLDGKALATTMRAGIAAKVAARAAAGKPPPGLAVVLVGDDPASASYVRNKVKACGEVGVVSRLERRPSTTTEAELVNLIGELNADPTIHGILVQLPLPPQIREEAIVHAVGGLKDVDCFHPENVGRLMLGQPRYLPCTPSGCVELLRANGVELAGKHAVVVGRSNIVGKPLAVMLLQKPSAANPLGCDATVTVAHTRTADLAAVCRTADVLVVAAGRPGVVTADMVKPGAAVVDVGTNSVNGKLVGDVHRGVAEVAGWVSPVPGGVGPMTITLLLSNALRAAELIDGPVLG
jgi:methylenetetrahydrofolate dehydrogenase (NADP+)/methenyltetrahydrofolate cyclohydrolase